MRKKLVLRDNDEIYTYAYLNGRRIVCMYVFTVYLHRIRNYRNGFSKVLSPLMGGKYEIVNARMRDKD